MLPVLPELEEQPSSTDTGDQLNITSFPLVVLWFPLFLCKYDKDMEAYIDVYRDNDCRC